MDIEQHLHLASKNCGMSIAELARRAGLPYSCVHGFVTTRRAITLQSAARVATVLGLELRRVRDPKQK
jgi:plasmid maintenance system antidote protein VapI